MLRRISLLVLMFALVIGAVLVPQNGSEVFAQEDSNLATASAVTELSNQFGRTLISARGNHFIVDSAPPLGHPAEEINPVEALLGALSTCGLFIYETAAQEMDIPLNSLSNTVQGDFDVSGLSGASENNPRVQEFRVHFELDGPDADQAAMLAEQFSMRCPIYTTLIKSAPIVITTNDEEMGGPSAEGLGTATISASLSNQPGRAIVNVRDNFYVIDSVPPLGGPNLAVNPLDLLLAAQGSCAAVIMERAAIDEAIPFGGVVATVEADFDPAGLVDGSVDPALQAMRVHFEIDTETPEEAQFLVDEWLARCPIYNTLSRSTEVEVTHQLMGEGTALLEIGFSYNVSTDEFMAEISPLAEEFANTDGLVWKLWALDEDNSRFSGLLLFDDSSAVDAFLEGELAATIMGHPALSEFEVAPYSVMMEQSRVTGDPARN